MSDRINNRATSSSSSAALSSRYAPISAVTTEAIIPASMMHGGGGAVIAAPGNNAAAILLDAAAAEFAYFSIGTPVIPWEDWATYAIDVLVENVALSTGNVVLAYEHAVVGPLGNTSTWTVGANSTVAAPGTAYATSDWLQLGTGIAAPAVNEMLATRIYRRGADAADTLANDLGLVAARFRKIS